MKLFNASVTAVLAAAALALCGSANATTFVENVSGTDNLVGTGDGFLEFGSISFPTVDLANGDSLDVNVTFSNAPVPNSTCVNAFNCLISLNISQGAAIDNGDLHLNYPYDVTPTPTGFSFVAQAMSVHGTPDTGFSFPIDSVSWNFGVVPEPAAWTMMLAGLFGIGAMARFARRTAARSALV